MTDFKVIYTAEAVKDLQAIYRYIAEELLAPQAARSQAERIQDRIEALSAFPLRHQLLTWEPWRSMGMRQMPVDRYIVYYLTDSAEQTVSVLRIIYGGRDLKRALLES